MSQSTHVTRIELGNSRIYIRGKSSEECIEREKQLKILTSQYRRYIESPYKHIPNDAFYSHIKSIDYPPTNCVCGETSSTYECNLCENPFEYYKCMNRISCPECMPTIRFCELHADFSDTICPCCCMYKCRQCFDRKYIKNNITYPCCTCITYIFEHYKPNYFPLSPRLPSKLTTMKIRLRNEYREVILRVGVVIFRRCGIYDLAAAITYANYIIYLMHNYKPVKPLLLM